MKICLYLHCTSWFYRDKIRSITILPKFTTLPNARSIPNKLTLIRKITTMTATNKSTISRNKVMSVPRPSFTNSRPYGKSRCDSAQLGVLLSKHNSYEVIIHSLISRILDSPRIMAFIPLHVGISTGTVG